MLILSCIILILALGSPTILNVNAVEDKTFKLNTDYYIYNTEAKTTKTLEELVIEFRKYSPNYRKIESTYKAESLNYDLYNRQYEKLGEEINTYKDYIKSYSEQKNNAIKEEDFNTVELCQMYISQYEEQLETLTNSRLDIKLKKDSYKFYKYNEDKLIKENQNKAELDFKKKCISIILFDVQLDYYIETLLSNFQNNNSRSKELKNSIITYEEYRNELAVLNKDYLLIEQLNFQITSMKYDLESYENESKLAIYELLNNYENSLKIIEAKNKSLDIYNKKHTELSKQHEKGKVAEIELDKMSVEKQKSEMEYYQAIYDYMILKEELDLRFE